MLSRNGFEGPLNAINISNLESITFSVKQRKNIFADLNYFVEYIYELRKMIICYKRVSYNLNVLNTPSDMCRNPFTDNKICLPPS